MSSGGAHALLFSPELSPPMRPLYFFMKPKNIFELKFVGSISDGQSTENRRIFSLKNTQNTQEMTHKLKGTSENEELHMDLRAAADFSPIITPLFSANSDLYTSC